MSSDSYPTSIADMFPPEGFNPADTFLNYTSPYGETFLQFSDLDDYIKDRIILAAIFGIRVGLGAIAIPVTFFVTKNKKSPLFILNQCCLVAFFLHSLLYVISMTKTYYLATYVFSYYIYLDRPVSNLIAATNTFYILLIGLVETSMVYQVYVIFRSPNAKVKYLGVMVTTISALLGLTTTGFYFAYATMANKALFDIEYTTPDWVNNACLICFSVSSVVMSFMLTTKLFIAIRTRRFLGLKQFGIFHVLFIMSFQTMIIPTVVVLISFADILGKGTSFQSLSAIGTALVTISLPITTMWANSVVSEPVATSTPDTYFYKTPSNSTYGSGFSGETPVESRFRYGLKAYSPDEKTSDTGSTIDNHDFSTPTPHSGAQFWKEVEYLAQGLEPNDLNENDGDVVNNSFGSRGKK